MQINRNDANALAYEVKATLDALELLIDALEVKLAIVEADGEMALNAPLASKVADVRTKMNGVKNKRDLHHNKLNDAAIFLADAAGETAEQWAGATNKNS